MVECSLDTVNDSECALLGRETATAPDQGNLLCGTEMRHFDKEYLKSYTFGQQIHSYLCFNHDQDSLKICSLVFLSPECALSAHWLALMKDNTVAKHICLIAVDEAHCVADW